MRFKGKFELEAGKSGKIDLIIDNPEDLWSIYNIVQRGDFIKTAVFRKIQHESNNGKVSSTKKKLILTIKVEDIDYDQVEGTIRFKGKNVSENENISIGQFQAAEISKGSSFSLYKKYWDEINIETLKTATDSSITADVAAIIMEEGVAHLYFITNNLTTLKGKITQSIPKKRTGSTGHDKSKKEFYSKILNQLVSQINFTSIKCVIVASPGFTKDEFGNYMTDEVENNNKKYESLKQNLNKFVYVHSSSGYKQSLEEVLSKPDIKVLIKNTKCADDTIVMSRFNEVLGKEMDKAFFGMASLEIAYEKRAIDTLIITDNFLRKISPTTRKYLSGIIKDLKAKGAKVYKMSSQHVTGEKIDSFGGLVGILTYVIPEISELGVDGLEIEEKKPEEEDNTMDENLKEMIENQLKYNDEEDEPEDEKPNQRKYSRDEEGSKRKKTNKEEKKAKAISRKNNARKKSSIDAEDDY